MWSVFLKFEMLGMHLIPGTPGWVSKTGVSDPGLVGRIHPVNITMAGFYPFQGSINLDPLVAIFARVTVSTSQVVYLVVFVDSPNAWRTWTNLNQKTWKSDMNMCILSYNKQYSSDLWSPNILHYLRYLIMILRFQFWKVSFDWKWPQTRFWYWLLSQMWFNFEKCLMFWNLDFCC